MISTCLFLFTGKTLKTFFNGLPFDYFVAKGGRGTDGTVGFAVGFEWNLRRFSFWRKRNAFNCIDVMVDRTNHFRSRSFRFIDNIELFQHRIMPSHQLNNYTRVTNESKT